MKLTKKWTWFMLVSLLLGIAGTFSVPSKSAAAMTQVDLENPGFESAAGGSIPGWTQTYGIGKFAVTNEQSNTGTQSLVVHDDDTKNYGMQSGFLPATPNLTYEASVFVYVLKGTASIYLQFHDENKVRIGYKSVGESGLNAWKPITASLKAPAGTKYVTVLLYSAGSTLTDAYFDDVQLKADTPQDPQPADPHVVRIGTAINSVTIPHAGYGLGPKGEPYIYATANGAPAVLSVLRADTGERVATFSLDQAGYSWGTTVAPNGDAYIATQRNGLLYRYRPSTNQLENVGKPISTETHLYRVVADEQGNIYGGTYPNGKLYKYNPVTRAYTDFGQLADGEKYVHSVAYGNGKVYAGTGLVKAQLFEVNPDTGEKTPIALPDGYTSAKEVYDLTFTAGLLFARMTAADPTSDKNNVTLVYDTASGTWIGEWHNTPGLDVSPIGPDGNVYFLQNGFMMSYNVASRTITQTSFQVGNSASRGFGWFQLNQPDMPGATLVSTTSRGPIMAYNPATGKGKIIPGDPLGSANTLRSLATGPDGNIYVGGYLSPSSMTRFNLDTFKMESLVGMSQVEGMGIGNHKLYMGVYPGAAVYEYDPTVPWTGSQGTNPARLSLNLGTYLQDRPFAFADAGDKLAIGTVPIAGKLGGALTLYDPEAKTSEVFYPIVENESPMALAYKDGLIYGGTTVWGGIAADPVEQDGTLFIFDTKTKQKVFEMNPIPGERAITALTFDESGMLWGLTNGTLFQFDPVKRQVVRSKVLYPYVWKDIVLAGGSLNFYNGMLYGEAADQIFRFDPKTWEHTTLTNGNYFAQDAYGRVFTTKNSIDLYMYDDIAPSFGPNAALSSSWQENGDLQLEWPVNADMKSFRIYRDGLDVTAAGALSRSSANGKASFLIPAASSSTGSYSIVAVDYAGNESKQPLSTVVYPKLYWGSASNLPPALEGEPYSVTLSVYGGLAPYNFTVTEGGLPTGVALDSVLGTVYGSPEFPGTYSFGLTVKSQDGQQATRAFTLFVERAGKSTLASLTSNTGVLEPSFQTSIHDYRLHIWPSVQEVRLSPVTEDADATIRVNGELLGAGQPVILNVKEGQTFVALEVHAPRGSRKTVYTVTVNACKGPKDGCGEPPNKPETPNPQDTVIDSKVRAKQE